MTKTKFLSVILAVLLAFSIAIFNNGKSVDTLTSADVTQTTPARNTVTEPDVHLVPSSLQLHQVNVSAGTNVFYENGVCKYKILYNQDEMLARKASAFIQTQLQKWTGVMIQRYDIATNPWSADDYTVVINDMAAFTAAGLTVPSQDLGDRGYYIYSKDKTVFIMAKSVNGLGNGAVQFLHDVVGYEQYSSDITLVNCDINSTVYMPVFNIIDKPDFEYSMCGNAQDQTETYAFRQNLTGDIFVSLGGYTWHNTTETLDIDTYKAKHPKWYSDAWNNDNQNQHNQICYTAHGDTNEYNAMVDEVVRLMKIQFDANPTVNNVTWTIQDVYNECTCSACKSGKSNYGAYSGLVVKMCNDMSAKLDAYYGPKGRTVKILFFAYHYVEDPPTKNTTFRPNVGVFIAPIRAIYTKSFYDTANTSAKNMIANWSKYTDNIYYWLYETNYSHYIFPYDSFDTMGETYRYCLTQGRMLMFNEGQYNTRNVTCFGKLKQYFDAKAMWDVNVSFKDVCDAYFPAMFGDASDIMRQYFDELEIQCKKIHATYSEIAGGIYENIAQQKCWPKALLDIWTGYINKAYKAVAHVKSENPTLYDAYCKNIKLESLFIQYAILSFYTGYYNSAELKAMRKQFIADETEMRNTNKSESVLLDTEFATWDN